MLFFKQSDNKNLKFYVLHILIISALVIIMVYALISGSGIFGSTTDWLSQHSVIPEYFRQQFYETGDWLSNFSFHLGAGQNSFNFIYHGYLTPITWISYLFPFIPMKSYIIGSTVIIIIITLTIFYCWMNKKGFTPAISFLSTLLFLFSSSLMYHAHKQVLFIQYMPFLMMALMGVDRFIIKKKRGLLIAGVLFMLITNYFFSVAGILIITIYAIHEYLDIHDEFSLKHFLFTAASYAISLASAGLISLFSLYPALLAILNGREKDAADVVDIAKSFIPRFKISSMLYFPYGMGLTCICFIALISFLVSKKRSRVFLSLSILMVVCIPFITYVLNIFLYDNSKIYITFIPVMCYIAASFLHDLYTGSTRIRPIILILPILWTIIIILNIYGESGYLILFMIDMMLTTFLVYYGKKTGNMRYLLFSVLIMSSFISFCHSASDSFISKNLAGNIYDPKIRNFISESLKDEEYFYRSNNMFYPRWSCNYIYSPHFYQTGLYSSIYNKNYNHFTHNGINLSNSTVNNISNVNTNDLLFSKFMGIKYIFTPDAVSVPHGYTLQNSNGKIKMYSNDKVYSILFGSDRLMSLREYNSLSTADRKFALLGYIIVDRDIPDVYTSPLTELQLDFHTKTNAAISFPYDVTMYEDRKIIADTSGLSHDGYIVEITISDLSRKQSSILVNGIENSISSFRNAFPKSNKTFSYVVTSLNTIGNIEVLLKHGGYTIDSIRCYGFSCDDADAQARFITMSSDTMVSGDNSLCGTIYMKKNGYINITVPYDRGFKLYVDGIETAYEKTDTAFIGACLPAGIHKIMLEYHTPGLIQGYVMSVIGCIILAAALIYDNIRFKYEAFLLIRQR